MHLVVGFTLLVNPQPDFFYYKSSEPNKFAGRDTA